MFDSFDVRIRSRLSPGERRRLESFLAAHGLFYEGNPEVTVFLEDAEGRIVATGSLEGKVIKMVAVDPAWKEAGLSSKVVSLLVGEARSLGRTSLFVFTKPEAGDRLLDLGFVELARYDPHVMLLEMGEPGVEAYKRYLREVREACFPSPPPGARIGGIVVNCNPFTRGHLWLVEQASASCEHLYVVVVEADLSVFPFKDRLRLVQEGTAHLGNVTVLRSGDYAVSPATFPSYFLKDRDDLAKARIQARLDVTLFARLFCRELGIHTRFVGTEPYCPITRTYNEAMREVLPPLGVEVVELPRLPLEEGGAAISASTVRQGLREENWDLVRRLVPDVTWAYLRDASTAEILERVRKSETRH